ncbi:hypothetical protein JRQ81_009648 [Phrynocephalus forsythii]|uniref:Uncharacterized protein n=1 Tax=Phrynocephalus forsythii TaxID=171643 RepID=A0A9Q0XDH6_9SAUR|nr:hypothetical protein JRQ81_009648 [Phrynocephalus forsythii]
MAPTHPRRAGVPASLWSGHERMRIGERLQASLAGIVELELLRETQRGSWSAPWRRRKKKKKKKKRRRRRESSRCNRNGARKGCVEAQQLSGLQLGKDAEISARQKRVPYSEACTLVGRGQNALPQFLCRDASDRLISEVGNTVDPVRKVLVKANKDFSKAGEEDPSRLSGNTLPPAPSKLDRSKSEDLLRTPKTPRESYSSPDNVGEDPGSLRGQAGDGPDKGCPRIVPEQLPTTKKAGINGGDTLEPLEADSRPSSGFYETSEMGSLSDSCPSVQSDGPGGSRSSVGSLSHLPGPREGHSVRPHSTDEAGVRFLDLQLQRLSLANAPGAGSRRPVSTGDLEFLLGLGDLSLLFSKNPSLQLLRYKSDLVSRNTNEIYHYPSPLHAVALQSPLFTSSLSPSWSQEDLQEGCLGVAEARSPKKGGLCSPEQHRARVDHYVNKLVLRYKCRSLSGRPEGGYLAGNQKSLSMSSVCSSVLGASQLLTSGPGWRIRRRISTCSHARSPEGSEGARDSRVLDSQGDLTPFPEIPSGQSQATNLHTVGEPSGMSLPEALPCYPEPSAPGSPSKTPRELENGALGWPNGSRRALVQGETSFKKEASPPWATTSDFEKLYKGRHASRELVKTTGERPEKAPERRWLNPRELLRRLSLRRRSSSRLGGRARASSEMNVHTAAGLACHGDSHAVKGKALRPRWASVLEISTKAPSRPRPKAGPFPPPHLLSRHLAFSSDSPATFCFVGDRHLDLPVGAAGVGLGQAEATSAVSLNGEWILHQLGERWPQASATLDSADLPVRSFKLRRSRSFKELKKAMTRSLRGSRTTK